MKHVFVGDSFEVKKTTFLFNLMLIYFPVFKIDKGFCPTREFVFCFSSADMKVKNERVELRGLMLTPCVRGS